MNLTLGTLTELKAHLLNEALRSDTQWDATLAALGKGVAERLQRACNRQFGYVVDDTFECAADRAYIVLPRYPVVEVTKIERRTSLAAAWEELVILDTVASANFDAGILHLAAIGRASERLRITYTGGYWFPLGSVSLLRGRETLSVSAETFAVSFSPAFTAAPAVVCNVIAPDGGVIISAAPSDVTAEGFTARIAAPIPAAGYHLAWFALAANQYTPSATTLKQDTLELGEGAEEIAVEFGTPFEGAPAVVCNVIAPDGGLIIAAVPAVVTASGFVARFAAAIPGADYRLTYFALHADEQTGLPSSMPGGATARPSDLYLAWLLQCEHVWKLRDKLGLATPLPAGDTAQPVVSSLATLRLVPEVEDTCRAYRRFAS